MSHYFDANPEGFADIREFDIDLFDHSFTFYTANGVFSKDYLDTGTSVMLRYTEVKEGDRVLDMGCGYGIVGISLAKAKKTDCVLVDVNKRALMLARKNAKKNNVSVRVINSDIYSKVEGEFDVILTNPPFHAGKNICLDIISGAKDHLKVGGSLQLVARKKKGGESLSKKMEEVFGNVDFLGIKSGFRLYVSYKRE